MDNGLLWVRKINERGQLAPKSGCGAAALTLKTSASKNKGVNIRRNGRKNKH